VENPHSKRRFRHKTHPCRKFRLDAHDRESHNRAEFIAAVQDGTLNYYTADHDEINVKIDGNHATLVGKSRVNAAVYGGGRHTWRLQQI
jgi:hypothetical protein